MSKFFAFTASALLIVSSFAFAGGSTTKPCCEKDGCCAKKTCCSQPCCEDAKASCDKCDSCVKHEKK